MYVYIVGFHCCDNTKHPLLCYQQIKKNSWFFSTRGKAAFSVHSCCQFYSMYTSSLRTVKYWLANAHFCNRPHYFWYKCGWEECHCACFFIQPHIQRKWTSVAAAGPHHHVLVSLQYDVGVVVEVQYGDGVELGGGATWLWHVLWVHQVHLKVKEKK